MPLEAEGDSRLMRHLGRVCNSNGQKGKNMNEKKNSTYFALRLTYGLVPIVAGLDKFTNLLTDWTQYLSPIATKIVPLAPSTFMHAVGLIEIAAGILVLSRFTRYAAFVVAGWLVAIALNLLTTGHFFDVAVRDVVMAVGAVTLAKLAELRVEPASQTAAAPKSAPAHA
jgi:uncharacterized membrane protein YphA (DoxX/SURF4 family)